MNHLLRSPTILWCEFNKPMNRTSSKIRSHSTKWFLLAGLLGISLWLLPVTSAFAKYPWEKEPGPIQGKWHVTCAGSGDMVIEFKLVEKRRAIGRVLKLGAAAKYGYKVGEEIFRVTGTDLGKWVGQLKWRSVAGATRWDPISFITTQEELNAIMTTDDCYKKMPRVP